MPPRKILILILAFALVLLLSFALWLPGFLVLDNAAHSDIIVVLDGHDSNFYAGLSLLRQGVGRRMLVCMELPDVQLTGTELMVDRGFVHKTAGALAERIEFCRNTGGGTYSEIATELGQNDLHSILIVAPEGESRVLYESARRAFPQYRVSVKPTPDPNFDVQWWKHRSWTKTFLSSVSDLSTALGTKPIPIPIVQRSAR